MKFVHFPNFQPMRLYFWGLALLLLTLHPIAQAQRVALLVGNASYSVGRLTNPPNDVTEMERALSKLGFTVQKVLNANQNQMKRAVRDFGTSAQGAEVAFVYYSGHATQAYGENYLLPVGASIDKESDYAIEAIAANDVLQQIRGAQPKAAILVLDACRDNPLAAATKSATKGLGRMSAPTGTMVAFATAPGDTASDNGQYAKVLARELQKPGQELLDVFRNTAAEVRRLSANGKLQDPRISDMSINERLYLAGSPGVQVASVVPMPTGRPLQADSEQEAWELAKAANSAAAYEAYLAEYPKGKFASSARIARAALASSPSQQSDQQVAQATQPSVSTALPGQVIKDCADCPEMVVLPAGSFTMGSDEQDSEKPPRSVSVRSFAAGKYAITKAEFAEFVQAKSYKTEAEIGDGCFVHTGSDWKKQADKNWRNAGFVQGDDHPVVCVSWNDGQAYAQWLSERTGKTYRLLSEAEREYAARAGSTSKNWWGDTASHDYANYGKDQCCGPLTQGRDQWAFTSPVGQFPGNAFGLFDMHGNTTDWVQDVWHDSYSGAPIDGSAWESGGDATRRVLRGASWYSSPWQLRSAMRYKIKPELVGGNSGFRLARTVP